MSNQAYKDWYVQGLRALKSATEQDKSDPSEAVKSISSPDLKEIMTGSLNVLTKHAENIDQLLKKAGGSADSMRNVIMEGLRAGSAEMIQAAKDPAVRDASIIAASQLTIHYYIAAYGTLAYTANNLRLDEDAKILKQMTDEMKIGDERLVEVAKGSVNKTAQAA